MSSPKWITPARQYELVDLFDRSGGFCVFGHKNCAIPEHHYSIFIDDLIKDWVLDDRAQANASWNLERELMHRTNDRKTPLHGQFSAVSKDIFFDNQPEFYVESVGVSGLEFCAFVKVRIASDYTRLFVSLKNTFKGMSKNERRKAIRYGKLSIGLSDKVYHNCWLAVKSYLNI